MSRLAALPAIGGLELDHSWVPFQPKTFCDSIKRSGLGRECYFLGKVFSGKKKSHCDHTNVASQNIAKGHSNCKLVSNLVLFSHVGIHFIRDTTIPSSQNFGWQNFSGLLLLEECPPSETFLACPGVPQVSRDLRWSVLLQYSPG